MRAAAITASTGGSLAPVLCSSSARSPPVLVLRARTNASTSELTSSEYAV